MTLQETPACGTGSCCASPVCRSTVVDGLRCPQTAAWADDWCWSRGSGCAISGGRLSDELGCWSAPARTAASGGRCSPCAGPVFNGRNPADPDAATELVTRLNPAVGAALDAVAARAAPARRDARGRSGSARRGDRPHSGAPAAAAGRGTAAARVCCSPHRRWMRSWTASPPASRRTGQASAQDRTVGARLPVPHGLQDQPVQQLHRGGARRLHGRPRRRRLGHPDRGRSDRAPAAQRDRAASGSPN